MLKKAARRADAMARLLPDTDPGKSATRATISSLGNECGCAMGGAFLIAASVLVAAYAVFAGEVGLRLVALGVAFVFAGSVLGKLTGVLVAFVRLVLIRRRLAGRVATVVPGPRTVAGGA